jgi:hypothetical protein
MSAFLGSAIFFHWQNFFGGPAAKSLKQLENLMLQQMYVKTIRITTT